VLLHGLCLCTAPHRRDAAPRPAAPRALVRAELPPLKEIAPTTSAGVGHRAPPPDMLVAVRKSSSPAAFHAPLPKDKPLVARCASAGESTRRSGAQSGEARGSATACFALLTLTANVSETTSTVCAGRGGGAARPPRDMSRAVSKRLRWNCGGWRLPLDPRLRSVRAAASPAFAAGAEAQPGEAVQVYAEVRTSAGKASKEGHETRLTASVEVRSADGQRLATVAAGGLPGPGAARCGRTNFLNCRFPRAAGLCRRVRLWGW